jgi:hypothetical protein
MVVVLAVAVVLVVLAVVRRSRSQLADQMLRAIAAANPDDEWPRAMLAEGSAIEDPSQRRRFTRGALWALLRAPAPRDRSSRLHVAAVTLYLLGALALAAVALGRYPELRAQGSWIVYLLGFVAAIGCYAALASLTARMGTPTDRAIGVIVGAPAVALGWGVGALSGRLPGLLVLCSVGLPAIAVAVDRRRTGDTAAPWVAGLSCVVATGLGFFLGFVTETIASNGGSPTASLAAQARREGYHSYAAWAVGDALGGACFMLALVLVVGGAVALLAGRLASPPRDPDVQRGDAAKG